MYMISDSLLKATARRRLDGRVSVSAGVRWGCKRVRALSAPAPNSKTSSHKWQTALNDEFDVQSPYLGELHPWVVRCS